MKHIYYSLLLFIMVALPIQAKSDGDVLVAESMLKRLIPAYGKIGVCCHSGLAERNAEYHVNSIFYNG